MLRVQVPVLILLCSFTFIWCFEFIPEQAGMTYINKKYFVWLKFYVRRYGRKSRYYINAEGRSKHTWANNVTVHFIFYEFLHNEYRRSFLEMHYKVCDLLHKDQYIGEIFRRRGVTCPAPPGYYQFMNITVPTENFPFVFPFEKGRVEGEYVHTETGELLAKGYINALFKSQKKPPKLFVGK